MQALDSPEHVLKRELVILHQAFHGRHLPALMCGITNLKARW
jgi:hypothetical protein